MRIFVFLAVVFLASCGEEKPVCAPDDMECWRKLPPPQIGPASKGRSAFASYLATCFVLFVGFSVWNGVRIIPNRWGLYGVQRSIQLFLVPFLVFFIGAVMGIPDKSFMLALAGFLFTPWFQRVLPRQQGDSADLVRTTEEWPWPKRKWVRYLIATPLFILGLISR